MRVRSCITELDVFYQKGAPKFEGAYSSVPPNRSSMSEQAKACRGTGGAK